MNDVRGFTLVEVLVAIVIVAIGLLGVAAMQASTLKTAGNSKYRSAAITLTNDMSDRLRANLEGVATAGRAVGQGYNRPRTAIADPAYATPVAACRGSGCSAQEMAQDDLATWSQRIAQSLPRGVGVVCVDSGTGGAPTYDGAAIDPRCDGLGTAFAIKVFWLDNRDENAQDASNAAAYSVFTTRVAPI